MNAPQSHDIPLESAEQRLRSLMRGLESVVVAFSGGIDSTLVAWIAFKELGARMLAVTSASESLKRSDHLLTTQLAKDWGMPHRVIHTREIENPHYQANPTNRCFYCKSTLYAELEAIRQELGFRFVANGTNRDDLGDFRPGLQAADQFQVRAPLVDTGFTKQMIRQLADQLGLRNAQKPQSACLSSRVPHGTFINTSLLQQIEAAEEVLHQLGFSQYRVRHHDMVARVELLPEELPKALELRDVLVQGIKACGYRFVALDLSGFRSGSMNPEK